VIEITKKKWPASSTREKIYNKIDRKFRGCISRVKWVLDQIQREESILLLFLFMKKNNRRKSMNIYPHKGHL